MPLKRYARKTRKTSTVKRTYKRRYRSNRSGYRALSRRISAISKRVAGEVCKFESTPATFSNSLVVAGSSKADQTPLNNITSGTPWIMPINWTYSKVLGTSTNPYVDGSQVPNGATVIASLKNPIWYNTQTDSTDSTFDYENPNQLNDVSPGLQYRLKYIYINALFNASVVDNYENNDGAVRIVIVKDKQPTGGAATWYDENKTSNSRGVFNAQRIDAQLNPNTVGRFKIMYDKTLRFTRLNGYKPFKYYKALSTVVRNNRDLLPTEFGRESSNYKPANLQDSTNMVQSNATSPPVQKNAFYIMIFSDGPSFTYTDQPTTGEGRFHLFNRVAYYNN